jgi:hypothetical protein
MLSLMRRASSTGCLDSEVAGRREMRRSVPGEAGVQASISEIGRRRCFDSTFEV